LAPGTYTAGLRLHGLHGRADAPIVIEGPAEGAPAVFTGDAGRNTVSIADAAYLTVRYLVLDGNGTGVDAVKAEGFPVCEYAHHITLEGLTIVGHGRHQQQVGISSKCPAWDWVVRDNVIVGAGTGMYFGNSDGNAPFFHGLIEGNRVLDSLGYDLQVKHQLPRPADLPGMPVAPGVTVIRGNVFRKAIDAGGETAARPNVLVGHFPQAGPGMEDEYLIEDNLFDQNPREALFQGEGNVTLRGNRFLSHQTTEFPAIAIQPHNAVPRRVRIEDNVVVTPGVGISVKGASPGRPALVRGNAVYAGMPFVGVAAAGNTTGSYTDGVGWLEKRAAESGAAGRGTPVRP
jgi:hypothetical protein